MANNLGALAKVLLSSDALKGISKQTDVSSSDVSSILSTALPALLNGASQQATQKSTAESFLEAIQNHGANDTSDIASFLKNVDAKDGKKIIEHLLSGKTNDVAKEVAKTSNTGIKSADVVKVLAVAAPLIMSLIGKQTSKKKNDDPLSSITSLLGNNEVQSLATTLLGGKANKNSGIDLGDVLSIASKFIK